MTKIDTPPTRWRIVVTDDRGITQATWSTSRPCSRRDAYVSAIVRCPQFGRVRLDKIVETDRDAPCPRCGGNVAHCGGPSDPHE